MKFICLLRGINVSGKNLIKMELLREIFLKMDFTNVLTYIQSGNIVFESTVMDEKILISRIEAKLLQVLNYQIPAMLRNFDEWRKIANNSPFQDHLKSTDYKLYVTFFNTTPAPEFQQKVIQLSNSNETFVFQGREMYSKISKDPSFKPIFTNNLIENKLKIPATTRNWNTIEKLLEYENL